MRGSVIISALLYILLYVCNMHSIDDFPNWNDYNSMIKDHIALTIMILLVIIIVNYYTVLMAKKILEKIESLKKF